MSKFNRRRRQRHQRARVKRERPDTAVRVEPSIRDWQRVAWEIGRQSREDLIAGLAYEDIRARMERRMFAWWRERVPSGRCRKATAYHPSVFEARKRGFLGLPF